jgi:hypothetical protein
MPRGAFANYHCKGGRIHDESEKQDCNRVHERGVQGRARRRDIPQHLTGRVMCRWARQLKDSIHPALRARACWSKRSS